MLNGFKRWLESSPSTRRALGLYPPQPGDVFVRPPYGKEFTCKKLNDFPLDNMDVSKICGGKKKKKKKRKK
jgi:hypothetical protein